MSQNERLPLNSLRAFVATARLESLSQAGEELHLSQAAVSRQMRNLAENLRTQLFVRERHGVRLTEHGKRLYATAAPLLDQLNTVAKQIRHEQESEAIFRIHSDPTTTDWLLLPSLPEIRARWPSRDFQLICADHPVTEYAEPINLGLQANRWPDDERFEVTTLCDDRVFPICSADHPALRTRLAATLDLERQTMLHLKQPGRKWVDWHEFCAHNAVGYPSTCEEVVFTNYPALVKAAVQGHGIGLAWERTVRKHLKDGTLCRLSDASLIWPHGVCAYLPRYTRDNRLAEEIVAWLAERVDSSN
ncbi:MAG: hypothetical protein CMO26_14065 [Thiotrichales bacterium]|nr:hypothetical protein [Thiotrichales bacterium]